MGLFKDLVGKVEEATAKVRVQKPRNTPEYQRINKWIESRIGVMDPADPGLKVRLDNLLNGERSRYPSALGRIIVTRSGNDTLISGDTKRFKGRLRSLGCKWDAKMRHWVAKDKQLTEADFDNPSELAGLRAYINTTSYRTSFDNKANP